MPQHQQFPTRSIGFSCIIRIIIMSLSSASSHNKHHVDATHLQKVLFSLIDSLDGVMDQKRWEILGNDKNGLYVLLGFDSFDQYLKFMISCAFVGNSWRKSGNPYFLSTAFNSKSQERYNVDKYGNAKVWSIRIGIIVPQSKADKKRDNIDDTSTCCHVASEALSNFWNNGTVREWLKGHKESHTGACAITNNKTVNTSADLSLPGQIFLV